MRTFWTLQNGFRGSHDSNVNCYMMGMPLGCDHNMQNHRKVSHDCLNKPPSAGANKHLINQMPETDNAQTCPKSFMDGCSENRKL